ncbi:hypothetical protein HX109_10925 [Galbibacter sp. BG1]|uniref:tail fiber protein n=1 Tax=Galbibacter sp. BG1 TaxID=1170699 RepID=UPI0015C02383|nr:tail fiber protein [Galbibacter sp. BG1]QLE02041.1 hypothetical protein HX109_10925 [Galbibacter sp. BG1]
MLKLKHFAILMFFGVASAYAQIDLDNHEFIRSKTASGQTTRIFGLNNQNWLYIGSVEHPISNIYFYNSGVGNVMSLRENGKVGIGTADPNATLQIGDSDHSGAPENEVAIKRLSIAPVTHSGSDWFFTARDNPQFAFLDIGYFDKKSFTLRHDGNLGIGSPNPDSKLTVNGKIHAKEVKLDLLGSLAPDYVFQADYELKSLKEVEEYIRDNGHLPNVPSANEMEEEGVHLKEMNLKLLEKVEELTLYAIEQKKESNALKDEIQKMKLELKNIKSHIND